MLIVFMALTLSVLPEAPGGDVFSAAAASEQARQYDNAAKLFLQCAKSSDELRPYALSRAAQNVLLAGNAADAAAGFLGVLRDHPDGPWVRLTQARLGALYLKTGDREQARIHLNAVFDGLPLIPWFLDELAWNRAENALALPQCAQEGYAHFRRVVETTLNAVPRRDAAKRLLGSSDPMDRAWGVYGMARSGNLKEAREALTMTAPSLADSDGTTLAISTLDEAFAGAETDAAAAAKRVEPLIRDHAGLFTVKLWLMLAARERFGANQPAAAEALADIFASCVPEGRDAGDVYWLLSERYEAASRPLDANRMYRRLADRCPDHVRAPRSLFNLANYAREQKRVEEAFALYEELGEAHPQGRFTAEGYYRCALLAAGQGNEEREQYYLGKAIGVGLGHYYAHRALHRLRAALDIHPANARSLRIDAADDFLQPYPAKDALSYHPHPLIAHQEAYRRLAFFGMHGLEEGEWEALACILAVPRTLEAHWYVAIADAGFMHTLMQFVQERGWGLEAGQPTLERLRVEYPLAYWPKMHLVARELDLDPFLLLAIAKQESTFRAGVVSSAGATGVLQLMPATASWLAKVDDRIANQHVQHLKSPVNSIRLGAVYLHRMLQRAGQNKAYALASYNAGPGNFDKWRVRFPNHALEDFIEVIPFTETNDYVKKILANYAAYHSLYPPPQELQAQLEAAK